MCLRPKKNQNAKAARSKKAPAREQARPQATAIAEKTTGEERGSLHKILARLGLADAVINEPRAAAPSLNKLVRRFSNCGWARNAESHRDPVWGNPALFLVAGLDQPMAFCFLKLRLEVAHNVFYLIERKPNNRFWAGGGSLRDPVQLRYRGMGKRLSSEFSTEFFFVPWQTTPIQTFGASFIAAIVSFTQLVGSWALSILFQLPSRFSLQISSSCSNLRLKKSQKTSNNRPNSGLGSQIDVK